MEAGSERERCCAAPSRGLVRSWRLFRVSAVLLFGVFALVQWNDPDPLAWIAVYGSAAATAAAADLGYRPPVLAGGLAIVCAVWMATLLPGLLSFVAQGDLGRLTDSMRAEAPESIVKPVIGTVRRSMQTGIRNASVRIRRTPLSNVKVQT